MGGAYLKAMAERCLIAAHMTADMRAKNDFCEIAKDLIRKANEIDGLIPRAALPRYAGASIRAVKMTV